VGPAATGLVARALAVVVGRAEAVVLVALADAVRPAAWALLTRR